MAFFSAGRSPKLTTRSTTASLIELSLRNHLCFFALRTEHGQSFHLGTIVRAMFDSFFLYDAGYGQGDATTFIEADLKLGETVLSFRPSQPCSLRADAIEPIVRLLRLFDNQLQTAPVDEIVKAHRLAEANFQASNEQRLTISALLQRSKRNSRKPSTPRLRT
jgi:hypothetical protein